MKNGLLYFLILMLFCFAKCNKDETCTDPVCQLPPATQEGKNTFGCLIDGKPWTANTSDAFLNGIKPLYPGFQTINGVLFFRLAANRRYKVQGIDSDMNLYVANAVDTGTYYLNSNTAVNYPIRSANSNVGVYQVSDNYAYPYVTDSTHTGQIKITKYDSFRKIYSGTFYFTAENIHDGKVVHVTDGRFDIQFQ